ncbi:MAG TPA: cyclic nucleotide-binding domain-containing protein [Azospirillum sp.]|nr:cyclic nucleotide-binding domain-containing protein [Azospirillum sp.]
MKMRYRQGDVLFREGDPSDFACRILEGRVQVVKESLGEPFVLGELGAGDYVGEMGVIEHKPRSATVRALCEVMVEVVPGDGFLPAIANDPQAAHQLLSRLSEKVRALSEEVVRLRHGMEDTPEPESEPPPEPEPEPQPAMVAPPPLPSERMIASYVQSARLGMGPHAIGLRFEGQSAGQIVWVDSLPFRIGRTPRDSDPARRERGALRLPDHPPYRLSPNHFAIDRDARLGLVVRDLGSELGTMVNGQYLGGIFAKDALRLQNGENIIVAGGTDSPFVFRIQVAV